MQKERETPEEDERNEVQLKELLRVRRVQRKALLSRIDPNEGEVQRKALLPPMPVATRSQHGSYDNGAETDVVLVVAPNPTAPSIAHLLQRAFWMVHCPKNQKPPVQDKVLPRGF